jgi:peptidoglycan/xylan/chitin deacetylase (PgdA/CDA1 family)
VSKGEVGSFERQMRELKARAVPVFADDSVPSNGRPRVAVTFDDALQNAFDNAFPVMARYQIPVTVFAPTGYLGREPGWMAAGDGTSGSSGMVVSARTLAACDRSHVRVASHTVTHPYLARLEPSRVKTELASSREALEGITGGPVKMLSFPYGSFNPSVVAEARAAGYDRVFANIPVSARARGDSALVGRTYVTLQDWPLEFRLKVQGAYHWLALAIPVKRTVLRLFGKPRQQETAFD